MDNNAVSDAVKHVFTFEAVPGMTLAEDVIISGGHLIAKAKTVLDSSIINKLVQYKVLEVLVENKTDSKAETSTQNNTQDNTQNNTQTYFDKIRESESFKRYDSMFAGDITDIKAKLDQIISSDGSGHIDTDAISKNTNEILNEFKNSLNLLDMIHSMRSTNDAVYTHCINVALLSAVIGRWSHFSEDDIKVLTLCGLLHDIGKLMIPKNILEKPGHLTAAEFELIKTHTVLGYEKIKNADIDLRVKQACLLHHEKCDGSGYPNHLTGDKIPDFTKIITIADVYDAMTSQRSYREPICPFTVISKIEADLFRLYDPKFMVPFISNIVTSYLNNNVRLSNGMTGEVVLINQNAYSRPIIKCSNNTFIDLSKETDISITAIL